MTENTLNLGPIDFSFSQLEKAMDEVKDMSQEELVVNSIKGFDVINFLIRDVIEADRKNTIKRLREFSEEKTRFAADVLQNDWFYGEK